MINLLAELWSYPFMRAVLTLLIAGPLFAVYWYGWLLLKRDRHQLVGESDVQLYLNVFLQLGLILFNQGLISLHFLEYATRILKLHFNISLAASFLYYILNEVYSPNIAKGFRFSVFGAGMMFIFMLINRNVTQDCGSNFWELFDLAYFASSVAVVYIGSKAISDIVAIENQNLAQPSDPVARQISLQLIRNQKHNYLWLIIGVMVGCLAFISVEVPKFYYFWGQAVAYPPEHDDSRVPKSLRRLLEEDRPKTYLPGQECLALFAHQTIFIRSLLILAELVSTLVPIGVVFYVFVAKNWQLLDYQNSPEGNYSEACSSLRSQLVEEVEMETRKLANPGRSSQRKFNFQINF